MYVQKRGLFTAYESRWASQYPGKYSKLTCNASTNLNSALVNFTKT